MLLDQLFIDQDETPGSQLSPLKGLFGRVDGFDAAVWKEFSKGERDLFDFFGDRIDEKDGGRLALRHGTIPVFLGKPTLREAIQRAAAYRRRVSIN